MKTIIIETKKFGNIDEMDLEQLLTQIKFISSPYSKTPNPPHKKSFIASPLHLPFL